MEIFKESAFSELASVHEPHCVSLYIPTHRGGGPEGEKQDRIRLKNQIRQIAQDLHGFGLNDEEGEKYLLPVRELLEQEDFWRNMSDGLAVFLNKNGMRWFRLPVAFKEYYYIADHYYLLPLTTLLADAGRHFIMTLSLNQVRFFEATRHTCVPVIMEGLIPLSIEEALGTDYKERTLQVRGGQGNGGHGIFHGHGAGSSTEKKQEILQFFQQVNEGLMKMIHDEHVPLVLACVDYLYPIYSEANHYQFLADHFIAGNHDETDMITLKERSWEGIQSEYEKLRTRELDKFSQNLSAAKSSFNEMEVIPASIVGKTETLFIRDDREIWGTYDQKGHRIHVDATHRVSNADLVNLAAVETIKHGGQVLFLKEDETESEIDHIGATFRYV